MAQYKPNFSQYVTGQSPADWASQWHPAALDVIEEDGVWGKSLVASHAGSTRIGIVYTPAANSLEQEGLYLVDEADLPLYARLRISGDDASETCYYAQIYNYQIQLRRYSNAASTLLGSKDHGARTGSLLVRFRLESSGGDTVLKCKSWEVSKPQPAGWDIVHTDSGGETSVPAGKPGFGNYSGTSTHLQAVSFADGGDTAPSFAVVGEIEAALVAAGSPVNMACHGMDTVGAVSYVWKADGVQFATGRYDEHTVTASHVYTCEISDDNGLYATYRVGSCSITVDLIVIDPLRGSYVRSASVVGTDITITPECSNELYARQAYARIDNVNGVSPTITFTDADVDVDTWASGPMFSYTPNDPSSWVRFDNLNRDAANNVHVVSHNTAFTHNTVFVAQRQACTLQYTEDRVADLIANNAIVSATPSGDATGTYGLSRLVRATKGNTPARLIIPQPFQAFRFGSGPLKVALITGQHTAEDTGDQTFWGFVDYALSAAGADLRNSFTFYCYPGLSKSRDGGSDRWTHIDVDGGAVNANRDWGFWETDLTVACRDAILADCGGAPDVFLDFHSITGQLSPFGYTIDSLDASGLGTVCNDDFIANYTAHNGYTLVTEKSSNNGVSFEWWLAQTEAPQLAAIIEAPRAPEAAYGGGDPYTNAVLMGEATAQSLWSTYQDGRFVVPVVANEFSVSAALDMGVSVDCNLILPSDFSCAVDMAMQASMEFEQVADVNAFALAAPFEMGVDIVCDFILPLECMVVAPFEMGVAIECAVIVPTAFDVAPSFEMGVAINVAVDNPVQVSGLFDQVARAVLARSGQPVTYVNDGGGEKPLVALVKDFGFGVTPSGWPTALFDGQGRHFEVKIRPGDLGGEPSRRDTILINGYECEIRAAHPSPPTGPEKVWWVMLCVAEQGGTY